jgi:hypothetical protein
MTTSPSTRAGLACITEAHKPRRSMTMVRSTRAMGRGGHFARKATTHYEGGPL